MLITHPRAHLLLPAAHLYAEVCAGRFGAMLGDDVCGPFLRTDVSRDSMARQMNALVAESDVVFDEMSFSAEMVGTDVLLIQAPRREVLDMVELYTRVLGGQWDFAASLLQMRGKVGLDYRLGQALLQMRVIYNGGYYPDHPHAFIGAAESTPAGKLAYLAWKMLGGGVPDSDPTFSLDGCWPQVREIAPA